MSRAGVAGLTIGLCGILALRAILRWYLGCSAKFAVADRPTQSYWIDGEDWYDV